MALAAPAVSAWTPAAETAPGATAERCPRRQGPGSATATVGCIVGQHGNVKCLGSSMLTDVVDLLIASDRSAAAIVDEDGELLGAITENDMVQAYAEGMEYNYMVTAAVWLRGGRARLPVALAPEMTVSTATPLFTAAEKMRIHALSDSAWRHLLVRDENGALRGILSSLDLARALCSDAVDMNEVNRRIGSGTVAEVMKPRATLTTCPSTGTMEQALKAMLRTHQNCVLVVDSASDSQEGTVGVVTPRDALRAFAEHVRQDVSVGHWLRGLQSTMALRVVQPDVSLADAGRIMANGCLHHLVVVAPDTQQIVGVVSSSDLAQAVGSPERVVVDCCPSEA
mmetsp:Transcript_78348/g.208011  ORF Transcript_78348/g.208011 Transcript_78348/m.208011 type:complete len:340 (-) Transcript_78348:80-1099(-)